MMKKIGAAFVSAAIVLSPVAASALQVSGPSTAVGIGPVINVGNGKCAQLVATTTVTNNPGGGITKTTSYSFKEVLCEAASADHIPL